MEYFDQGTGEVTILAKKPGLVIGKGGSTLRDIASSTGWRSTIIRSPPLKSRIIEQSLYYMGKEQDYRLEFLRKVGRRIHRPEVYNSGWVTVSALGGFREVGRQAILVQTLESRVLIDCGVKPGAQNPFRVYAREGERCPRCRRASIRRLVQAQRSTFFCPRCQR